MTTAHKKRWRLKEHSPVHHSRLADSRPQPPFILPATRPASPGLAGGTKLREAAGGKGRKGRKRMKAGRGVTIWTVGCLRGLPVASS